MFLLEAHSLIFKPGKKMLECQGISSKARLLWRNQICKGLKENAGSKSDSVSEIQALDSIKFGNLKSCSSEHIAF